MYVDGIPSYMIKKVDRPKIEQSEIVLPHINVEMYKKGRSKWQPVTMELYEPIVPSGAQIVMEWVRLHHESVTGRDGYSNVYQKDVTINGIGPGGEKVQEWTLVNSWITNADFQDFDWSSESDITSISLTLRYDYAIGQY